MLTEEMSRANRRLQRAPTLDARLRALLQSVERGEWTTIASFPAARARYARYAKTTLRRRRTA